MFWTFLGYASVPALVLTGIALIGFITCVMVELLRK